MPVMRRLALLPIHYLLALQRLELPPRARQRGMKAVVHCVLIDGLEAGLRMIHLVLLSSRGREGGAVMTLNANAWAQKRLRNGFKMGLIFSMLLF